jgi:hypothetical protein
MSHTTSAPFERYVVMDYADELRQLPATFAAATAQDVSALADWLRAHADRPLLALGAGGSLAIAQLAATLHTRATGRMARAGEPMDLYLDGAALTGQAVLQVTASGGHSDSLTSCALLPGLGVDSAVFAGRTGSAGEALLTGTGVEVFAFDLLPDVHGWVAVNVLLAQAVVLARAFTLAHPQLGSVPVDFAALLPDGATDVDSALAATVADLADVFARPRLVALYGPDTKAVALDLDSKFAESGLGALSMSEYRNFAHGRYQSMLPDLAETAVLAFAGPRERVWAESALDALPDDVPAVGVLLPDSGAAAEQVVGLARLLFVVGALGRIRSIDVGWGSRNTFGDVLYELDLDPLLPA